MSEHESLFDDWGFLAEIGAVLAPLAAQYGVPIPTGTDVKSTQERAKAVDTLLTIAKPWPSQWTELAVRLHANRWLRSFIHAHVPHGADWLTRDAIMNHVLTKLMFAILRNAEKWHALGNHDQNWQGWIRCQVPSLAKRAAQAEMGSDPDRTNAENADSGDWLSQTADSRELLPPDQAEFNDGLDKWSAKARDQGS